MPRRDVLLLVSASILVACTESDPSGAGGAGGAGTSSSSSASAAIASTGASGGALPDVFIVSGVVTDGASPLEGATVMQGGGAPAMVTGPDGAFSIEMTQAIPGTPTLVAAKVGYRSAGIEITDLPEGPLELALREVAPPDDGSGYVFMPPGTGDPEKDGSTAVCGHCHSTLVTQFLASAHARSARDPLVVDLYAGTSSAHADAASCVAAGGEWRNGLVPGTSGDVAARCYLGRGVLPDLNGCGQKGALACDDPALPAAERPTAFGACADCHAAGLDGKLGGRDLHEAKGIAFENGNHCDVCHKVRDVDLQKPPGTAGRLVVQRPNETFVDENGAKKTRQVMFGPLLDVPNEFMGGSPAPIFSQATFCAGCHEHTQAALLPGASLDPRFSAGLPVHSTYTEWAESPWAASGAACQHCHMPPLSGFVNSLDVAKPEDSGIAGGFVRAPGQTRSHTFRGPLSGAPRLLDSALGMWASASLSPNAIDVSVTLSNQGCGHALPTGEPMRVLLLSVRVIACGQPLAQTAGATLPDIAGAFAEGVVGQTIGANGATLTWAEGASSAVPGQIIRVVRDTGLWEDDPGVGYFSDVSLSPAEKGIPRRERVGEALVVAVAGDVIELDAALPISPGDLVFLGNPIAPFADGAPALALAGSAGKAFARVLVDPAGNRLVPHHAATSVASDNRLLPLTPTSTSFSFALPAACPSATVTATALYRPIPLGLGRERGTAALDFVVATRKEILAIP